jgi:hypothetical protein
VIAALLSRLTGEAPSLPPNFAQRKAELASRRAKAAVVAEREREAAQAAVAAAAERARRASAAIDADEAAVAAALATELGIMLYAPGSALRAAIAAWLEDPSRPNARRLFDVLRELDQWSRDYLNAPLDSAALSLAWLANLIDDGREDLIAKVGAYRGWSYGDSWLATGSQVLPAALDGSGNLPELEARLAAAERAFAQLLGNTYGVPNERARAFWSARISSGTQAQADRKVAALPRKAD